MRIDGVVRGLAIAVLPAAAIGAWMLQAEPASPIASASSASAEPEPTASSSAGDEEISAGSLAAESELASGTKPKRKHRHAYVSDFVARDLPVAGGVAWPRSRRVEPRARGHLEIEAVSADAAAPRAELGIEQV